MLKETTSRNGAWSQLQPQPAWPGNWTHDGFVAYAWSAGTGAATLVVVNYAPSQGQCRLLLPSPVLRGRQARLTDVMGTEVYVRDGGELVDAGRYIDRSSRHSNVFCSAGRLSPDYSAGRGAATGAFLRALGHSSSPCNHSEEAWHEQHRQTSRRDDPARHTQPSEIRPFALAAVASSRRLRA